MNKLATTLVLASIVGVSATADATPYRSQMIWVGEGGQVDWDLAVGPSTLRIVAYKSTDTAKPLVNSDKLQAAFFFWPYGASGDTLEVRFGLAFEPDSTLAALNVQPMATMPVPVNGDGMVQGLASTTLTLPASLSRFGNWCTEVGANYKVNGMVWAQLPGVLDPRSNVALTTYKPVVVDVSCVDKPFSKDLIKTIKMPTGIQLRAPKVVVPRPLPR